MSDTTSNALTRRGRAAAHRSPARGETRMNRLGRALRKVVTSQAEAVRTQARGQLDRGIGYVRNEPVKALALAGVAGAVAGLLLRRSK